MAELENGGKSTGAAMVAAATRPDAALMPSFSIWVTELVSARIFSSAFDRSSGWIIYLDD